MFKSSMRFLLTNPYDDTRIWLFSDRDTATSFALQQNQSDLNHPAMRLYEVHDQEASYVGRLWREFGHTFDPVNCWKLD